MLHAKKTEEEKDKLWWVKNIFSKNPLLALGLSVSPAVLYADTLENAVILAIFISVHTFFTLLIASFIPRKIVYISRVILYTLISALMFTALNILSEKYFSLGISSMGYIAVILIINPLIISRSELEFFRKSKGIMIIDIFTSLLGYSSAVILSGFLRELISSGGIGGRLYAVDFTIPAFSETFGGFILLGLLAALVRLITGADIKSKDKK